MHQTIDHVIWTFEKSLGIWLSAWAIRYKAQWDYKLSPTARALRWAVVLTAYWLAVSATGPGFARVISFLIGLGFLCWPNFAYHLSKLFVEWPTAKGRVVSAESSDNGAHFSYMFQVGDETFGGNARRKENMVQLSEGQRIVIAYDPLNPDESKVVSASQAVVGELKP
jgi:hypothetical protein